MFLGIFQTELGVKLGDGDYFLLLILLITYLVLLFFVFISNF